jgi:alpha-glucosidase
MLCDSPSNYQKEEESTRFLSTIPVTWDELKVIDAKIGEYLIIARRKGDVWYLGGLNGPKPYAKKIDLSFIGKSKGRCEIFKDGINADRFAEDYKREVVSLSGKKEIVIDMVKGGGFAARIE